MAFALFRGRASSVWIGGVLHLPVFPLALLYEAAYWRPVRLGGGSVGIEDALCAFLAGAIAWYFAVLPHDRRLVTNLDWRRGLLRYAVLMLSVTVCISGLTRAGVEPMTATVLVVMTMAVILVCRRWSLWRLAAGGALGLTAIYTVTFQVALALWPEFTSLWNAEALSGASVLGMPVEEIAWSVTFGALWPLLLGSAFDLHLKPSVPAAGRAPSRVA